MEMGSIAKKDANGISWYITYESMEMFEFSYNWWAFQTGFSLFSERWPTNHQQSG